MSLTKWRAGQVKIENTFGILTNKFRELNVDLPYASYTIIAYCALHNFCIDTGDVYNKDLVMMIILMITTLELKGEMSW